MRAANTAPGCGVPGARNVDHYAITVPNLNDAIDLFVRCFGAQLLYTQGPVVGTGDFMARQLGVDARASCYVSLLRLDSVCNLELFEYEAPSQSLDPPTIGDIGDFVLVFAVEDFDRALEWVGRSGELAVDESARPGFGTAMGIGNCVIKTKWGLRLGLVDNSLLADDGRYRPSIPWTYPRMGGRPDSPSLPGNLGVGQLSYTVPDLDCAVQFFTTSLGGIVVGTERPISEKRHRGITDEPDRCENITLLRLGPVSNVELRECHIDRRHRGLPMNSDVGGHHLAIYTDDMPAALDFLLTQPGVEVMGVPQVISEGGPIDGANWIYFRSPWGMQLELVCLPDRLPYEFSTPARRFGPSPSWMS